MRFRCYSRLGFSSCAPASSASMTLIPCYNRSSGGWRLLPQYDAADGLRTRTLPASMPASASNGDNTEQTERISRPYREVGTNALYQLRDAAKALAAI